MASSVRSSIVICLWLWVTIPFMQGQTEDVENTTLVMENEKETDVEADVVPTCYLTDAQLFTAVEVAADKILQETQCNSRELNDKISNFGTQLGDQLNVLKTMILNMEDKIIDLENQNKKQHRKLLSAIYKPKRGSRPGGLRAPALGDYDLRDEEEEEEEQYKSSLRSEEIEMYNSTIHTHSNRRVFTYYWKVTGMEYKMTGWNHRRSLRSQSFYIFRGGYRMYLRIYPNQSGENVYIHVGITQGEYDDALEWPFKLKNKINVLDQSEYSDDISSRIWDPAVLCSGWNWRKPVRGDNYECVGLGFPHDVIRSRNYILNDSIIIKLTVFLE